LLGELYLESHRSAPEQIVLDLDATDIPLYGHQPERFFHGYYGSYYWNRQVQHGAPRVLVCFAS
jgi:hypothetical protein